MYSFQYQSRETAAQIQRLCDMLNVRPPVDVVLTVAVITGAAVVDCLTCPTQVPTFPALSTAVSSTFCEQQEAL